jgi:hypothetical protein
MIERRCLRTSIDRITPLSSSTTRLGISPGSFWRHPEIF